MMKNFTERFFSAPADSFFIFGPRGTGKSTWLKKTFPDAYLVDLLDDRTFRNHIAHPERIKQIGSVVNRRPVKMPPFYIFSVSFESPNFIGSN